jgi:MYXO-CTERM domain-containing protein
MKRLVLLLAACALVAASSASAKGPDQATITGPGLEDQNGQIVFASGGGDPGGGTPFMAFVDGAGFFPQTFGQSPDPTSTTRPKGDLGPRYNVVYRVPGPNGGTAMLHQTLYPFASIGGLTYMPPGQSFFDGQKTHGGWFAGSPTLKATLVSAGLPESAPTGSGDGSRFDVPTGAWPIALVALLALGALALVVRRRPRLTPAS